MELKFRGKKCKINNRQQIISKFHPKGTFSEDLKNLFVTGME